MAESVIRLLRQQGFSELACQFARFVERQGGDQLVTVSAALVSEAVLQGQVSLDLSTVGEQGSDLDTVLPETAADWSSRLLESHLVVMASEGSELDEVAPLVLTPEGRLYLYRYWHDEQQVNQLIAQRLHSLSVVHPEQLKQDFANWQHQVVGIDWQKVAVMMALTRQFCVISGGPGTGKTTIVLQLLKLLHRQDALLRVALAAPTGKAAMRLQQAISAENDVVIEAKTVHRLLGITEDNERGQYHADRLLPVDMVIIDEASMIDISLMARLLKALPKHARLVLLGDSEQLASVESGTVLADLCQHGIVFSDAFRTQLAAVTEIELPSNEVSASVFSDSIVLLQHSYRFGPDSVVARLAQLVREGDAQRLVGQLSAYADAVWQSDFSPQVIEQQASELLGEFVSAVKARRPAEQCLVLFEQARFLCALKQGPQSVDTVNVMIERWLMKQGIRTQHRFYHGRPILVTKNDYRHGLFNGDTGLVLYDECGQLSACFMTQQGIRWIALNRLPAHETAYAMTVHKSQGSEFERVCIVLPNVVGPVLTRSLLYTAITRAKTTLSLVADAEVLSGSVGR